MNDRQLHRSTCTCRLETARTSTYRTYTDRYRLLSDSKKAMRATATFILLCYFFPWNNDRHCCFGLIMQSCCSTVLYSASRRTKGEFRDFDFYTCSETPMRSETVGWIFLKKCLVTWINSEFCASAISMRLSDRASGLVTLVYWLFHLVCFEDLWNHFKASTTWSAFSFNVIAYLNNSISLCDSLLSVVSLLKSFLLRHSTSFIFYRSLADMQRLHWTLFERFLEWRLASTLLWWNHHLLVLKKVTDWWWCHHNDLTAPMHV